MKKILALALAGALTFSMAACGSSDTQSADQQPPEQAPAVESSDAAVDENMTEGSVSDSEPTAVEETQEVETAGGKVLVAYFSWSGNTEQLAEMVQSETGADLFEITPETPYTEDYDELLDVAQQEQSEEARPALASQVENWDEYSTVFVGYPNWWSDAPRVILSFLESYDCTGKTIVPFCTSGGGGFGSSVSSIEGSAAGATIAEGFHVGGSSVGSAGDDVAAWISGLNLAE